MSHDTSTATRSEFRRDAPTRLSYAALMCFAFWVYGYGPALALLRDELHFSYAVLGVYSATWSVGTVLTGLTFAWLARRMSRPRLLGASALVAGGGAGLFVLGTSVPVTLAGAGILGAGGTTLLTVLQGVLSDGHGEQRDRALTEANIGAAACAVLAPLVLGALALGAVGWRAGFVLPVLGLAGLLLVYRRQPLPRPHTVVTQRRGRLPLAGSLFAALAAASMAVEFCLVYFGAEQLVTTGLSATVAATAMSCHYLGLLAGRIGGAVATRRAGRTVLLLHLSLAVTAIGFGLFWLGGHPAVALVGLLLAGVGVANLYPLSVALSLGASPGLEDRANSLSQLLGGLLVITAPYLLGSLADPLGLTAAFAVEPVLLVLCLVLLLVALRQRRTAD
jgi:MFS family permease